MRYIFIMSLILFIFAKNSYAYLDPGTGSYILQIIVASLLGALFAVKVFWRKIVNFFKSLFKRD